MATNDTAALVVALSAQVSKFEKDMKEAVSIADRRTKEIETRFGQTNKVITDKLSELGTAASSQIGVAGALLRTLGPAGIAAAVGIGTAVGGILALANATDEFATKAKKLKEGAETIGLTITQLKALGQSGARVGLDFDETTAFFTKFIANLEALRGGSGPLFEALLKIDTQLLRQLSTTKDSAEAIDLLAKAFARLDDQTKKLDLARAAGGRAGLTGARLLDSLAGQGGVGGLVAKTPGIDEEQIKRAAQLKVEIEEIRRKAANVWGGMFSDDVLQHEKETAEQLLAISKFIERIVAGVKEFVALKPVGADPLASDTFADRFGFKTQAPTQITVNKQPAVAPGTPTPASPSVELAILQKNIALLGEGVTQGELWRQKRLEIKAAAEKGGVADGVAQRALSAFSVTMLAAAVASGERLGVATEEQIVQARLAQLSLDRAKFGLSENEVQKATVIILREAKEAADALTVRQAYLPGLKQLELDAQNLRKSLDSTLVSSLNSVTDNLADVVIGAKSASQAFTDMTNSILRDIARLVIRQTITGPLAGAIDEGLKSFGIGSNAGGTDNWRGGWTWVGERGPELLNLPSGSQIIPNSVARSSAGAGGGGNITIINPAGQPAEVESRTDTPDGTEIRLRGLIYDTLGTPKAAKIIQNSTGVGPQMRLR